MNKKRAILICLIINIILLLLCSFLIYKKQKEKKIDNEQRETRILEIKELYSPYIDGKKLECDDNLCNYLNNLTNFHNEIEKYESIDISLDSIMNKEINLDDLNKQKGNINNIKHDDINKYLKSMSKYEKEAFLNIYNDSKITKSIEDDLNAKETILKSIDDNINILDYLIDNESNYMVYGNKIVYYNDNFKNVFTSFGLDIDLLSETEAFGKRIPILMYHGVDDSIWGNASLFTKPSEFEKQMQYLSDNEYTTLFLSEIDQAVNYEKPVIITFDDGYMDMYTIAYPIMKAHNIKSNMYIISGWLDDNVYMNADMVKELSDSNLVEIGSHTVSHVHLNTLSYEEQEKQLLESKETLESITGKKINTIAYPYGQRNYDTLVIAKKYYDYAVTTESGPNYSKVFIGSTLLLKRYNIQRGTSFETFKNVVR